jgi:hypothetical protein
MTGEFTVYEASTKETQAIEELIKTIRKLSGMQLAFYRYTRHCSRMEMG